MHFSRMPIHATTSVESVVEMNKSEHVPIMALADCRPEVIMYGCTASTLIKGRQYDLELMDRFSRATGIAFYTATEAILRALEKLGIGKLCLSSPYTQEIEEQEIAFFTECGLTVAGTSSLNIKDLHEIGRVPADIIYKSALESWTPGSDGLLISCLAYNSHWVAQALEDQLGVPVVTSTTATLWAALRAAGNHAAVKGYGRILRE